MDNKEKLIKRGFDFSPTHKTEISAKTKIDASELLDGYVADNTTNQHAISWDNAKLKVNELIKQNILTIKKLRTINRGSVVNPVYEVLEDLLGFTDQYKMNCFILNNPDKFASIIQETTEKYIKYRNSQRVKQKNITSFKWAPANRATYNKTQYTKYEYGKYAYQECWLKNSRSSTEKDFEAYIDGLGVVKYWYKNGDNGKTNLGIPYTKSDGTDHTFYPDFIIQLTNDKICLCDTKGGNTAEVAKEKANVLYKYCQKNKLFGGIVVKQGSLWKINIGKNYTYSAKQLDDSWIDFNQHITQNA